MEQCSESEFQDSRLREGPGTFRRTGLLDIWNVPDRLLPTFAVPGRLDRLETPKDRPAGFGPGDSAFISVLAGSKRPNTGRGEHRLRHAQAAVERVQPVQSIVIGASIPSTLWTGQA